eukprot:GHVS01011979.1.p1 GENE.GHVS01011979.1~~GHVS01011979.1.p1  ORF type:complete len:139 (+),score=17.35 GHVS01011979.1:157-573(+)
MDPSTPVLVSGGYDSSLLFWSAHCGDSYKSIPHTDTHINAIAVSPDYTTLAVAGNPTLRFYDVHIASVDRPQPIVSFQGYNKCLFVFCVCVLFVVCLHDTTPTDSCVVGLKQATARTSPVSDLSVGAAGSIVVVRMAL